MPNFPRGKFGMSHVMPFTMSFIAQLKFVWTANHTPATPWPLVWPGAVSLAKVYNGCPLYVTCCPLAFVSTPSFPGSVVELVGVPDDKVTRTCNPLAAKRWSTTEWQKI